MPGDSPLGYEGTPHLPGSQWRVHDPGRPQPAIVTPGPLTPAPPPADATVLFDGSGLTGWTGRDGPAAWRLADDWMEVVPGSGDIETAVEFGDCQLHVEWAAPVKVSGSSQGRGNSGVFLMGRYEIQVLDGYDNPTYADGAVAAVYGQQPPLVNASRPPGEWQEYDIVFTAPRWQGTDLVQPAYVTVFHNGVLVHDHQASLGPTTHQALSDYAEPHPATGPLKLQDHGDPVWFRNIKIRRI